jgi:hypothetical protein
MPYSADAENRYAYEVWHKAILGSEPGGLMALYAKDAMLESPLILATVRDKSEGILGGNPEIWSFLQLGLRELQNDLTLWHRTGTFSTNGRALTWEYPRDTPQGNQVDLVEVPDIENAPIVRQRIYWRWAGFKVLVVASDRRAS